MLIIIIINITIIIMENTTIAVTNEVKDKIKEFGQKGETYSQVIERLLESARKRMIQDFLMSEKGFVPIEDAVKEANRKWPKSR